MEYDRWGWKDSRKKHSLIKMEYFTIVNLNASRCSNVCKIREIYDFIASYRPTIVGIQEINISSALKTFTGVYQVYCNIENNSKDGIGIVTLVKHGIKVMT